MFSGMHAVFTFVTVKFHQSDSSKSDMADYTEKILLFWHLAHQLAPLFGVGSLRSDRLRHGPVLGGRRARLLARQQHIQRSPDELPVRLRTDLAHAAQQQARRGLILRLQADEGEGGCGV